MFIASATMYSLRTLDKYDFEAKVHNYIHNINANICLLCYSFSVYKDAMLFACEAVQTLLMTSCLYN